MGGSPAPTSSGGRLGLVTVMKLVLRGGTVELAPSIRPGRLTVLAATVALVLSALASSVSPVTIAAPADALGPAAPGTTAYGNDISWPQCPKAGGGYGLPGPMATATFVVLGLTDGGSFRANPCLVRQVASVRTSHLMAGAYAVTTYPTSAELTRYGGSGPLLERLGRVGAAQAGFNIATMARAGLRSPMVWVDVEPRTKSPWSDSAVNNNAVIDGVIARYRAAGLRAGIYSYAKAWRSISGARVMPREPTWVPVGHQGRQAALATCAVASYAGSRPWLTQWTDGRRDYNLTCPGVTGWTARGNLLTPYLNLRLAGGSRGGAVAELQRRLGVPIADGTFGPTTRDRVVAFQRARHLTVNGIVGRATWLALGAGSGTYTPPVRGFMEALFARQIDQATDGDNAWPNSFLKPWPEELESPGTR
jgi:Putative peptidoglycan binding domain